MRSRSPFRFITRIIRPRRDAVDNKISVLLEDQFGLLWRGPNRLATQQFSTGSKVVFIRWVCRDGRLTADIVFADFFHLTSTGAGADLHGTVVHWTTVQGVTFKTSPSLTRAEWAETFSAVIQMGGTATITCLGWCTIIVGNHWNKASQKFRVWCVDL